MEFDFDFDEKVQPRIRRPRRGANPRSGRSGIERYSPADRGKPAPTLNQEEPGHFAAGSCLELHFRIDFISKELRLGVDAVRTQYSGVSSGV